MKRLFILIFVLIVGIVPCFGFIGRTGDTLEIMVSGSVDCTGLDWYWNISDGADMTADCYDATDGNTISGSSTYLTAGTGYDGGYGLEITSDPGATDGIRFVCTNTNNINIGTVTVDFYYKETGTAIAYSTFFRHDEASTAFFMRRSSTGDTYIELYYGTTQIIFPNTSVNIFDGSEHHVKLVINDAGNTEDLYIDNMGTPDVQMTTAISAPSLASGNMWIGSNGTGAQNAEGVISEFKIY